jgi:hypothetical protein
MLLRKGSNPLEVNPDWNTLKHNEIFYTEALLTKAETAINRIGNYNSQLYFLEVNGEMKNVIVTTWKDKINQNGLTVNARVFFNQIDGTFIDAYKIEEGRFTKRLVPRKKKEIQKAGFFLLFQSNTLEDCWNTDVLGEFEGGELEEVVIIANGGGSNSSSSSTTYYYYINNAVDYGNENSTYNNSPGGGSITNNGITNAATAILMNPPVDPDDDGNCPEGYTLNPVTGECESICNGGKEYNTITENCECPTGKVEDENGNCNCPEGKTEDKNGNCVDKPCEGNPVQNLEIAPQLGDSGMAGGLHNTCTRTGSGCLGNPSRKTHDGVDIKNPYGAPVFAMYDGTATLATQYKPGTTILTGAGYHVSITSTIDGETVRMFIFICKKTEELLVLLMQETL